MDPDQLLGMGAALRAARRREREEHREAVAIFEAVRLKSARYRRGDLFTALLVGRTSDMCESECCGRCLMCAAERLRSQVNARFQEFLDQEVSEVSG